MHLGSSEHEDILKGFEKTYKGDHRKEKDEAIRRKGFIYANGEMNRLYKAYISGYAHGRCNYLNGRWEE